MKKKEVILVRRIFLASDQVDKEAAKKSHWSRADLKAHFKEAAARSNVKPKPEHEKSVDGMFEYLLSTGYIEL